jgi:hypothetical protein
LVIETLRYSVRDVVPWLAVRPSQARSTAPKQHLTQTTPSAVPRPGESCPQATTAASQVWTAARKRSKYHVRTIAALPTDTPTCVVTNANSRLNQRVTAPRTAESNTVQTALHRARRTPLPATPLPSHSPGAARHPLARVSGRSEPS